MHISWFQLKRAGLTLTTWLAGAYVLHGIAISLPSYNGYSRGWAGLIIVVAVFIITRQIWRHRPIAEKAVSRNINAAKQLSVHDMMALLDEDDLDDLRDEARESLRAQIRRLSSDVDVESFETLMSETRLKRKRTNY